MDGVECIGECGCISEDGCVGVGDIGVINVYGELGVG